MLISQISAGVVGKSSFTLCKKIRLKKAVEGKYESSESLVGGEVDSDEAEEPMDGSWPAVAWP